MTLKQLAGTTKTIAFALAAAAVLPASATTYYWIGGASGAWTDGTKWSLTEGGAAAGAYPSDYSIDEAFVTTAATISLPSANANVSNLVVNANVSLTGGKICAKTFSGSGKLTMLDGTAFYASEYRTIVSVDVEVPSGATVYVSNNGKNSNYGFGVEFTDDCALTGSGTIVFDSYRSSNPLYWDASGFSGTNVVVKDSQSRNNTTIRSTSATHAGMAWQIANSSASDTGFVVEAGTYEFGSLSGEVYLANSKNSESYAYVKNVYLEIGGLNGDDVLGGQVSRTATRANDGAYIRKVGTGVLSSSVKGVNGYYIKEGVLNIASDDGLSVRDDSGNPGTDIVFTGGVLRVSAAVTKDVSAYIALGTSSSPVAFDDEGRNHVWNTALGASLTGGLTKKGSGTLTLAAAPAYTGTTTLEGGILVVPQGTTIAELSCVGGKMTVPFAGTETDTPVLTISALAAGTTLEDVEDAVSGFGATMSVEAGVSGYVVKATRTQQTYIWTGAVDSDWSKSGNWTVGEAVPLSVPTAADSVVFPASETAWEVSLSADAVASNIVFNAATEITGGSFKITVVEVSGTGTVTAKGLTLVAPADTYLYIRAPLDIPEGFVFETATSTQYNHVNLYSKVTGSGEWKMNQNNTNQRGGVQFRGDQGADMSEFAGTLTVVNKGPNNRDQTALYAAVASSSNAVWNLVGFDKSDDDSSSLLKGNNTTYYFGALNGYVCASGNQSNHNKNTWEIGAREDTNSVVSGNFFCNSYPNLVGARSDTIRKVGAGSTLTFSGVRVRNYEINAGVLKIGADASLLTTWDRDGGGSYVPPITFNGGVLKLSDAVTLDVSTNIAAGASSSAVVFDDEGVDRTWEVAIPGSGGLVKKGEGTLTLTAAPLYTGLTTVEEGALVVPADSAIVCNAFSAGTISGLASVNYAYPEGTTLTGGEANKSLTGSLDITNVAAIDVSGATLTKGQPFVIASATAITGYTKESLAAMPLTLPEGVDAAKWKIKVQSVNGDRALCVAPKILPMAIILR